MNGIEAESKPLNCIFPYREREKERERERESEREREREREREKKKNFYLKNLIYACKTLSLIP